MGLTFVEGQALGPNGQEETVSFLVDSGAGYNLLLCWVWQSLGLEPTREEKFSLADSTIVTRNLSRCYPKLPQGQGYSPVILGEESDDQALPGPITLREMGLVLNPFNRTLHPMRLLWQG